MNAFSDREYTITDEVIDRLAQQAANRATKCLHRFFIGNIEPAFYYRPPWPKKYRGPRVRSGRQYPHVWCNRKGRPYAFFTFTMETP